MAAIILAGGKSRRIGRNKAFIRLSPGNQTIIENQIKRLKEIFGNILIVTNSPEEYRHLGVKVLEDILPGKGSLGGIYSGLSLSKSFHNFFLACDMPFPDLDLIGYMKGLLEGRDVVIPRSSRGYEALCAFYSKNCLPFIKRQMEAGNLKIIDFFPQVKVRAINTEELKRFTPARVSFFNVNRPEDLEKARGIAARMNKAG